MKSLLGWLLLLTSAGQAAVIPPQVWNGSPHITSVRILHVNGVPMMARLIQISYHTMGCQLLKDGCSVGSQLSFWMQTGSQEHNCYQWFSAILLMESTSPNATPYPYLQLLTQPSQLWTDEGLGVYPVGAVSCNGSLDWTK